MAYAAAMLCPYEVSHILDVFIEYIRLSKRFGDILVP